MDLGPRREVERAPGALGVVIAIELSGTSHVPPFEQVRGQLERLIATGSLAMLGGPGSPACASEIN